jgi:oligosaccharide repeat unit polymerase
MNFPVIDRGSKLSNPPELVATLEACGYLTFLAMGTVLFAVGCLTPVSAAYLTLIWLLSLVGLAWRRFDQGRHPAFFFLCLLTLFQGGHLLAWGVAAEREIFRVTLMTATQFDVPRDVAGTVLLSIALSGLAIYAPCRWSYQPYASLDHGESRFLPYFYWLFSLSLPLQLYKNYCYYAYARDHGGYLVFFIDHGGMAASIPLLVRAVSLISLPALVGIFVLEQRKKSLRIVAIIYFAAAAPVLLTGSRGAIFSLILSLWYVMQVKSARRIRPYTLALVASSLLLVGLLIGSFRIENGESRPLFGPAQFIADQGLSLNVTEVAVLYRARFAPHIASYLGNELQSAFVSSDQTNYVPGKRFSDDVAIFLNPITYQLGFGSGSSYIAEAYVLGGLWGVVLTSLALGTLLHLMHLASRHPLGLFLTVMILPDVLWMSRGGLLDWVSATLRVAISVVLLALGWQVYRVLAYFADALAQTSVGPDSIVSHAISEPAGSNP